MSQEIIKDQSAMPENSKEDTDTDLLSPSIYNPRTEYRQMVVGMKLVGGLVGLGIGMIPAAKLYEQNYFIYDIGTVVGISIIAGSTIGWGLSWVATKIRMKIEGKNIQTPPLQGS